jgi:hypothetical protein
VTFLSSNKGIYMIEIVQSKLFRDNGFTCHGFTQRKGGISPAPFDSLNLAFDCGDDPKNVASNIEALKTFLKLDAAVMLRAKQIHGDQIVSALTLLQTITEDKTSPPCVEADGIISPSPLNRDIVIAVQTADCIALLLADPKTGSIAALHAGWRGLAKGLIRSGVRQLLQSGSQAESLIAAIGPCICTQCYTVGPDVAHFFPESIDPIAGENDRFKLDLVNAAEVSLIAAGLRYDRIDTIGLCTACHPEDWFSYRTSQGRCGRSLGFIGKIAQSSTQAS